MRIHKFFQIYQIAYVEKYLSEKEFHLDTSEIDSLIEAAVLELKIATKEKEEA